MRLMRYLTRRSLSVDVVRPKRSTPQSAFAPSASTSGTRSSGSGGWRAVNVSDDTTTATNVSNPSPNNNNNETNNNNAYYRSEVDHEPSKASAEAAAAAAAAASDNHSFFAVHPKQQQQQRARRTGMVPPRHRYPVPPLDHQNTQQHQQSQKHQHAPKQKAEDDLVLVSSTTMVPHPHKKNNGEDAYFICENGRAVGIADGVGGWASLKIDSGVYSRELMSHAQQLLEIDHSSSSSQGGKDTSLGHHPKDVLIKAYNKSFSPGSCTACVLSVTDGHLHSAHIGDSGFMILRRSPRQRAKTSNNNNNNNNINGDITTTAGTATSALAASGCGCGSEGRCAAIPAVRGEENDGPMSWRMVYQTKEQQHFFNCPVQIGPQSKDKPWQAQTLRLPVQPGDLIVCATDGLFDNLFVSDICAILDKVTPDNLSACPHSPPPASLSSSPSDTSSSSSSSANDGGVSIQEWARTASDTLASEAGIAAASLTRRSPFTTSARKAGFAFEGGKLDDITVIVSFVTCDSAASSSE